MEIQRALDQISEIHGHLAKTDVYRGYRAVPVAFAGVLALVVAAVQTRLAGNGSPLSFVLWWVGVALIGAVTSGGGILYSYVRQESEFARRRTRTAVGQLLPCLVAGAVITVPMTMGGSRCIAFLPGLWAMLFSLGIFASRPYLPRIMGWIALYYLVAGAVLLAMAFPPMSGSGWGTDSAFEVGPSTSLSPWGMGLTFGVGQLLSGIVLYWNLEREDVSQGQGN
jgi:hypothetical protein